MSLDNVKWRKPVKPGDQLRFELDLQQMRGAHRADARQGDRRRRSGVRGGHERDGGGPVSAEIHPTAIVDKGAQLGADVEVGPFAIIGPHCVVGDGGIIRRARRWSAT